LQLLPELPLHGPSFRQSRTVITFPEAGVRVVNVVIATGRQAHYRLAANALVRRGCDVSLYTTTSRSRMRGFDPAVHNRWIPAPVAIFSAMTHGRTPLILDEFDSVVFDHWAAAALRPCDLLLGAATSSLATGKAAQRRGGVYVLDRACPDIRVQQQTMVEEARKAGGTFRTNSPWFIERQVEEYERADFILSPSDFSRRSYPEHLRKKVVLAPLYGCSRPIPRTDRPRNSTNFVLGVVGGSPLRKGLLYLLRAWKELALPTAELRIRTSTEIFDYPVMKQLVGEQSTVSVVSYVPDINDFYRDCDAFILPSVDEGFGLSLIESMANGVASIATRNCGASELLVPDRDFLLIDAFSVEQIKTAVLRLYESRELRESLGEAGREAAAALEDSGSAKPYVAGMDHLLQAIASARLVQSAA
jgi:glycosyltransferase involved in cell wall biosynthesis